MPTVRIACQSESGLCDQLRISNVCTPPANLAGIYKPQAIVPAPKRRSLTDTDRAFMSGLLADTDTPASTTLEFFRLNDEHMDMAGHEVRIKPKLQEYLGSMARRHMIYSHEAGLHTTAYDTSTNKRSGLHVDNYHKLPLADRTQSERCVGVNLGPGHRYLVMAMPDVVDMAEVVGVPQDEAPRTMAAVWPYAHSNNGQTMRSMRCLWFCLEPGEGYVAPTELMVHDGSTRGMTAPSRIAFWLGHWPLGMFPSKFAPEAVPTGAA